MRLVACFIRCSADVCALIVAVDDAYIASLATGANFTCSMDPGRPTNSSSSFVFDFGHNMAGYAALRTTGLPAGATLLLRHAELIHTDTGMIDNTYCGFPCTCGGDGGNCANQVCVLMLRCHLACLTLACEGVREINDQPQLSPSVVGWT